MCSNRDASENRIVDKIIVIELNWIESNRDQRRFTPLLYTNNKLAATVWFLLCMSQYEQFFMHYAFSDLMGSPCQHLNAMRCSGFIYSGHYSARYKRFTSDFDVWIQTLSAVFMKLSAHKHLSEPVDIQNKWYKCFFLKLVINNVSKLLEAFSCIIFITTLTNKVLHNFQIIKIQRTKPILLTS